MNKENYKLREELFKINDDVKIKKAKILFEKRENITMTNLLQVSNNRIDEIKNDLKKEVENQQTSLN